MNLLTNLLFNVTPLFVLIILGYLAGKIFKVNKKSISPLLIYIISPIVIFNGIVNTELNLAKLSLPLIFFCLSSLISLITYQIAKHVWQDASKNILAFTAGTGNTGYFGLPVAIVLFGDGIIGLVALSVLGFVLYENTVGYYLVARGNFSVKESLKKIIKLPAVYAFIFGVLINLLGIQLSNSFIGLANNFKGAYTVLGMMLVGLGISDIKNFKIDLKFLSFAFLIKFIFWPTIIACLIFLDQNFWSAWSTTEYRIMFLMASVPLAANTVAYATELKAEPEKAAITVAISTVFGIFYTPLLVSLFL